MQASSKSGLRKPAHTSYLATSICAAGTVAEAQEPRKASAALASPCKEVLRGALLLRRPPADEAGALQPTAAAAVY